jgi:penicillin-binding protein 1A
VRSVLGEVVRSGTGQAAAPQGWKAYGKTGTTTGNADAWFVGWSEGRVLGVWMGRRRDAAGEALAGRGAPAEYFRRVAASTNAMADYRLAQERGVRAPAAAAERPATPGMRQAERPRASARDPRPLPPRIPGTDRAPSPLRLVPPPQEADRWVPPSPFPPRLADRDPAPSPRVTEMRRRPVPPRGAWVRDPWLDEGWDEDFEEDPDRLW